ncbi:hypothetical protein TRIUR3_29819 [Triticum urartu]|uniref:Uncharacterized protein n=1 Tax=Triticum urartu TaxID=4572 RepID=M7ZDQ3_TRIUA|nr:hypothetical protein TRIUR3_29819 [Triticum urartu]
MAPALATLQVAAPHHLRLPRPRASQSGGSYLALEVARNSSRRWPSSPSANAVLPKTIKTGKNAFVDLPSNHTGKTTWTFNLLQH